MPAGRPRLVDSPETLWTWFEQYRAKVKANPRIRIDYVGKDGMRVETPLEAPLTMEGFKVFVWDEYGDIGNYLKGEFPEYIPICSRIKEEIRNDQIQGGMVGQYNASITQRLNGLTEKQQIEVKSEQPMFGPSTV